jgi:L,D-transpeptidase catalytic domain
VINVTPRRAAGGSGSCRPDAATARCAPINWRSRLCATCVAAIACAALLPAGASAASAPGEQTGGASAPAQQPVAPSSTPPPPPLAPSPARDVPLSNERTVTTWAQPESTGGIYVHPVKGAARIANVLLFNADGFPEVYMLLSSHVDAEGQEWVKVRVPGRPNGRTGWMLRKRLGSFHRTSWRIVVNRAQHRMRVYHAARLLRVFPVGVGKPSTPTPVGHFWIDERFKLSNPSNPYWPYALGTSDYSTLPNWAGEGVIGIHGPFGEPQRIPGDPSHGCIRMLAPDIAWLGPRVTLGTPVDVLP